ncbi:Carbon monoxide dehydrogenase medium chain [Symmachiella dynata]|uniref:Carbon monoxide dehydrogenase medium chain n=1 Tax=Symmachiella dynata TaxID=2527995 RepID=A0A517ZLS3_9PLAN|nr:FAD binding domain-containing protein [Symmachiella dynata]QDU43417.1 Carbon monoxide dehydrogenase medium chain [Symmachiella dynata]
MKSFEFANPQSETEALELMNDHPEQTAVLAGGTDLISLLQADIIRPERVVDIKNISSMHDVAEVDDGLMVGALTTLEEVLDNSKLAEYASVAQAADAVHAIQIQSSGTIAGDLCHLPNCWYYRNGYGMLGLENGTSLPETGDNRYHAIFGNSGPAKFVTASRFAPALIAWGAKVRIIGPGPDEAEMLPLEYFYTTPRTERQGTTVLKPGQLVSHIWLPKTAGAVSGNYDVLQTEGLDWPLASASATLKISGGRVSDARIVLGHVAPTPWVSHDAATSLLGKTISEATAQAAGDAAVSRATPLSDNGYKVQLARTAVKRAILRSAGLLEGGL